ncbi:MAG: polymerase sigma-70 factor, subfamily [Actinomycetota bacterium]|jgi:RNA polymerase sigma-70 factor (ECF subfamily)|nr:polymerase sigma-70 factor, subfamily [Actinomycetota bacterium]
MASSTYVVPRTEVDRLTFEDFYAAEFDRVLDSAFAFSGDRDAATDATQEAFARAFARWRRLSRKEWAGGWVTTTALNVLRRRYRDAARSRVPVEEKTSHDAHGRVDLLRALRALPIRQREAAVLFYVADLPLHAVAEAMGISEGAVKSHLARAREGLRVSLEERDA